jgi:hypothetical protein
MVETSGQIGFNKTAEIWISRLTGPQLEIIHEFIKSCPRHGTFVTQGDIKRINDVMGIIEGYNGIRINISAFGIDEKANGRRDYLDMMKFLSLRRHLLSFIPDMGEEHSPKDEKAMALREEGQRIEEINESVAQRYYEENGKELFNDFMNKNSSFTDGIAKRMDEQRTEINEMADAIESLRKEKEGLQAEVEKLKGSHAKLNTSLTAIEPQTSDHVDVIPENIKDLPRIEIDADGDNRWDIITNEDGEIDFNEVIIPFKAGNTTLSVGTDYGTITWAVTLKQNGGETLYGKIRSCMKEYLENGNVLRDDVYYPYERKKPLYYTPQFNGDHIVRQGYIENIKGRRANIIITLSESKLRFALEFRVTGRMEYWRKFINGLIELLEMLVKSSTEIGDKENV